MKKFEIKKAWKYFKTKIWPDPVGSTIISAAILGLLSFLFFAIKSLISKISFVESLRSAWSFLGSVSSINNAILILTALFATYGIYFYVKTIANRRSLNKQPEVEVENRDDIKVKHPIIPMISTAYFETRLASAFPGDKGIVWYNEPKIAVERLVILLQEPLTFTSNSDETSAVPIWWYRGYASLNIRSFKKLSKTKVLMNEQELEIKRIAACKDQLYWKSFLYVETKGEVQTGLYKYQDEDFQRHIEHFGYSWEEYSLLNGKAIRREEHDDGAAVIKGKVVNASDAQLRTRYLSNYNFIIAAHDSPYNSDKFQIESEKYFNDILKYEKRPEDFFSHILNYPKKHMYY